MRQFLIDTNLTTDHKGPTFINSDGVEVSEIDYFLYSSVRKYHTERVSDIEASVSDHYPIEIRIQCDIKRNVTPPTTQKHRKLNWEKVDKQQYEKSLAQQIPEVTTKLHSGKLTIEEALLDTITILTGTAKTCSKKRSYGQNKLSLNVWNNDIKGALKCNKEAHQQWKKHGRPNDPTNSLVIGRKETRKIFRRELRLKENKRRHEERNRIINANSDNKRLFFKLVTKQRKNGNVLIDDLYVNDNLYKGSDVVNGWHEHFSILAQPSSSHMYDYGNLNLCDLDYQSIKEIRDVIPPRTVSIDEISTAIKSINTG